MYYLARRSLGNKELTNLIRSRNKKYDLLRGLSINDNSSKGEGGKEGVKNVGIYLVKKTIKEEREREGS